MRGGTRGSARRGRERPRLLSTSALALAALSIGWACTEPDPPRPARAFVPEGATVTEWSGSSSDIPPSPVEDVPSTGEAAPVVVHLPAAGPDPVADSTEIVAARRIVYRVRLGVPGILGSPMVELALPAAELYVDVSDDRLRARFVGTGWPVDAGAEVRLRGDSPGAYVVDGLGGRPLEPAALSEWFEGGPRRPGPRAYVRRDAVARHAGIVRPGALVCALVAEWAGEPRGSMLSRCGDASPIAFRVGYFRGDRTADVPLELPRSALRADEAPPLPEVIHVTSRALLEPDALERLHTDVRRGDEIDTRDVEPPVEDGLVVVNLNDGRMIVVVDGVAAGWLDGGATAHFTGFSPGVHEIGGMRPGGAVIMRPRLIQIPGRTVLRYRPPHD